jgi:starch phosphorylase
MNLADLQSYLKADLNLVNVYADTDAWTRKAILNVAASGKFSSDRTIAEYATDIWKVKSCPVP